MTHARYDDIAGWYRSWVSGHGDGLIAERVGDLLPSSLHRVRVLDVASVTVAPLGRSPVWARLWSASTFRPS